MHDNDFFVGADDTETITIAFAPTDAGDFDATLTLESNDPMMPEIQVPVFGAGFVPNIDDGGVDGDGAGGLETRGCGCDSTPTGAPMSLLMLGLLGLVIRRRQAMV